MKKNYKKSSFAFCLAFVFLFITGISNEAKAQTCSVNAGTDYAICISGGTITLTGSATGALSSSATWSLVSGPNTPTITSPSSPTTTVTGFITGVYKFRYFATCSDAAVASDTVTVSVNALPVFTAGTDINVCVGTDAVLNATLPTGATGIWSQSIAGLTTGFTGLPSLSFANSTSPTSNVSDYLNPPPTVCPLAINAIWTVTQGACKLSDTVLLSFKDVPASHDTFPDLYVCGTSTAGPYQGYGCGGSMLGIQIAGPSAATIKYGRTGTTTPDGGGIGDQMNLYDLIPGTYTFAYEVHDAACSGHPVFRDTFNTVVRSSVPVTTAFADPYDYPVCPEKRDSVYYMTFSTPLAPGETLSFGMSGGFGGPLPYTIINPTTIAIKPNATQYPDSLTGDGYNDWLVYAYVTNGICTSMNQFLFRLENTNVYIPFTDVINVCGSTSTVINPMPTGFPGRAPNFENFKIIAKPSGAPDPTIAYVSGTSDYAASGLVPGTYVFSFDYRKNTCGSRGHTVTVNVGSTASLSNAGTNQVLPCGTDSTTLAGNTPLTGTGTWSLVSGPSGVVLTNPHSPSLIIKSLTAGVYTFRWSIASGSACPSYASTMQVVVNTNPHANAGADQTVCYGASIPLNGNATILGTTGVWHQIGGPAVSITDTTAANTTFTGSIASTAYTFTWTLSNNCGTSIDTVVITTNATAAPSDAIITTADQCISTTSINLTAVSPFVGTGAWTQASGPGTASITSPDSASTTATGLSAGTYQFVWTTSNGTCAPSTDTVSISVSSPLTANAGADQNICSSTPTLTLNGNTPTVGTGTWTQIAGGYATITSPNSPTSTVTGLLPGNSYDFVWTVSNGACPSVSDSVHITVDTPPTTAVAMADSLYCGVVLPYATTINIPISANTPTVGIGAWSFLTAAYEYVYAEPTASITNPAAASTTANLYGGTSTLIWSIFNGGCPPSRDTVTIQIVPKADVGTHAYSVCQRDFITVTGTSAANGTSLWSQISGPTTATISTPTKKTTQIANYSNGVYKFKYEVTDGTCTSFDTLTISNYTMPTGVNAGNDTTVCWLSPSITMTLHADTPTLGAGQWYYISGSGCCFSNGLDPHSTVQITAPGLQVFKWYVTNGACAAFDYVSINTEQLTVPHITFSPTTACNDSFTFSTISPYTNMNYEWSFQHARIADTSGLNLTGPIANNFLISDTNNIYLRVTDPTLGCTAIDSTPVIVTCSYLALPLQLLSFDAAKKGTTVLLDWTTVNEKNVQLFNIQRSADGSKWTTLGKVNAKGDNNLQKEYTYTDLQPLSGINLYRLSIEELDGTHSYSPTRMVQMNGASSDIIVYPNPAQQEINVVLQGTSTINSYELVDALGRVIQKGNLLENTNNKIDVSSIGQGVYVLKIRRDQNLTTRPIQIQR